MNSYGNAVSGIDAGAVSASATAAQALSRLQASLPNVGGTMPSENTPKVIPAGEEIP